MGASAEGDDTRIYIISGLLLLRSCGPHGARCCCWQTGFESFGAVRNELMWQLKRQLQLGKPGRKGTATTENGVLDTFSMSEYRKKRGVASAKLQFAASTQQPLYRNYLVFVLPNMSNYLQLQAGIPSWYPVNQVNFLFISIEKIKRLPYEAGIICGQKTSG